MNRRQWLSRSGALLGSSVLGACGAGGNPVAQVQGLLQPAPIRPATGQANTLALQLDPRTAGVAVNRAVLGQNLHWVDRGDEMFDSAAQLRPAMASLAAQVGCTSLRYPGGLQSDTYHWKLGMGLLGERGLNEHANARRFQPTLVGTQEFLELCEQLGAQPLITVNLASGSAAEAADWVRAVNVTGLTSRRTGQRLPRVPLWELGNEPYLQPEEQPGLWMSARAFAQKAREFAKAMRQVDPGIALSLPITLDRRHGVPATPLPGFAQEVLASPIDGVTHHSLHNAYLPFGSDAEHPQDRLYWAAMAAGRGLSADLAATAQFLRSVQPQATPRWAITEFNALFSLGRSSDSLTLSAAGGLALAELLRQLVLEPDVALAQGWSLSGNGFFGALHPDARLRPTGQVLALFREGLVGQRLPCSLQAPTVNTPALGFTPAAENLPVAEVLACREGDTLRLLVLHKDPSNPAELQLDLGPHRIDSGRVSLLSTDQLFDTRDLPGALQRTDRAWPGGTRLSLPAHSLALLTLVISPQPDTATA
ncbi:MAG: hypothetical protein RLZZ182_221 [Pseudomonadota bacterium]